MRRMTAVALDGMICLALLAAPAKPGPAEEPVTIERLLQETEAFQSRARLEDGTRVACFVDLFIGDRIWPERKEANKAARERHAERLAELVWPGSAFHRGGLVEAFEALARNSSDRRWSDQIRALAFMLASLGRRGPDDDEILARLPLRSAEQQAQARAFLAQAYENFRTWNKERIKARDPAFLNGEHDSPGFLEQFERENFRARRLADEKAPWSWKVPSILSNRSQLGLAESAAAREESPALIPRPAPNAETPPPTAASPERDSRDASPPAELVGAAGLNWDLVGPGKPYHWGLPGSVKNGRPNEWNVYAEDGRRVGYVFINRYGVYLFHHNDSEQVFHYNGGTGMHDLPTGATASLTSYARRDSVARRQMRDQSGEYRDAVMAPAGKSAEGRPAYLGPQGEAYETKVVERQELRTYCRGLVLRRCYSVPVRIRVEEIRQARTPL